MSFIALVNYEASVLRFKKLVLFNNFRTTLVYHLQFLTILWQSDAYNTWEIQPTVEPEVLSISADEQFMSYK